VKMVVPMLGCLETNEGVSVLDMMIQSS